MSRVKRWLRDLFQKAYKIFYEGPEPPTRLREMVSAFAIAYPNATRADWIEFASSHAEEAYRSAYIRGFEWRERQNYQEPILDPIAELPSHDWAWGLDETPPGMNEVVRDGFAGDIINNQLMFAEELIDYVDQERRTTLGRGLDRPDGVQSGKATDRRGNRR